ncbi:tRNA (adenosine(37)-N6)-threonylcarbamoyltransferase complex dimerization subunit type 1 TsaB [Arthrobacter caoxuetaonis]|uniref:tRNA (Adenosine(37)-N6)-threonylcarbamoyltransferase complex dimerization subunit type 1 TsaB n=1 Tax=Arthrobacter caoxuetaonis TaxID=2886935 RepID=A0A9X1SBL8_9MICC|nr:tRNA (adenosine(37)-N6)-threonylcarbamoyltransferase complex dimerization subunit type 1 TsaB [Arthrobacter caoxuetaonis]MCC3296606.1 tRNA (adenosine(37)-N6)-threonylcarbamoyltransferase complex dimerization subunit type 1 TsaB [Arthrobacter caoxuetaonis]USQ56566.1 tRNA (adenosine(37)-N6)-threonylcarbamoyltransferase complex dimerization subunit type 1 TsaB [Arthrobacter caoxuetaonis]
MLILAIDTSAIASAALLTGEGETLAAFATEDTRSHAEVLAPGIQDLLKSADVTGTDIDELVVGVGPGPFTGLRSGIATARTLAFAWNKPLHGVMSLDAIAIDAALDAWRAGVDEFVVATDARRKEVYWAHYRSTGGTAELIDGPHVTSPSEVPALPAYGAGAGLYPDALHAVQDFADAQPTAAALGRTAVVRLVRGLDLLPDLPLYLRESDAKVPGPRKRAL